jgi:hypothetical protein
VEGRAKTARRLDRLQCASASGAARNLSDFPESDRSARYPTRERRNEGMECTRRLGHIRDVSWYQVPGTLE